MAVNRILAQHMGPTLVAWLLKFLVSSYASARHTITSVSMHVVAPRQHRPPVLFDMIFLLMLSISGSGCAV